MSILTDNVQYAQRTAAEIRPEVGGFPVVAETCAKPESTATSGRSRRARACT